MRSRWTITPIRYHCVASQRRFLLDPAPFCGPLFEVKVCCSRRLGNEPFDVTDLESLTIANEPTLYFTAKLGYARIGPMTLEISGGLSVNPAHTWMALDVGLGATVDTPIPYTELRTRVLYAWTQGSSLSAAGSGIAVDLGIFVCIPLF